MPPQSHRCAVSQNPALLLHLSPRDAPRLHGLNSGVLSLKTLRSFSTCLHVTRLSTTLRSFSTSWTQFRCAVSQNPALLLHLSPRDAPRLHGLNSGVLSLKTLRSFSTCLHVTRLDFMDSIQVCCLSKPCAPSPPVST